MEAKPHVSAALAHLRFNVAAVAVALCVAVSVQLMVFGFVHFTDARWEKAEPIEQTQALSVVSSATETGGEKEPDKSAAGAKNQTLNNQRKTKSLDEIEAEENALVLSKWHFVLNQFSDLAVTVGTAAAVALAVLVCLGVVVAGGGSVPGVEKAVTSCTWALVLGLLCLPWQDIFASMPFEGIFGSYEQIVLASEAVNDSGNGSTGLLLTHLALPMAALVTAMLVALRFWAGVSQGVIVTSVSELDQAIDREISAVRAHGPSSNIGPRSVGVLNQAVGERTAAPEPAPRRVPATGGARPRPI